MKQTEAHGLLLGVVVCLQYSILSDTGCTVYHFCTYVNTNKPESEELTVLLLCSGRYLANP